MLRKGTNLIAQVLREKGKSRKWVCENMGLKRTTFDHWVRNHTHPSIFQLKDLANLLGVRMEDLIL